MNKPCKPIKSLWNESDFEVMGWHDCSVYGIQFQDNVTIDLDYISEWILNEKEQNYDFCISPASLEFKGCRNLQINIELDFVNGVEIAEIKQEIISEHEQKYIIELQEGTISLIAKGFEQIIRKEPIRTENMFLPENERNG